jgi:hypothetical protein
VESNPRSPVAEATSHVQCLEICCISYGRPRVRICLPPTESPCLEGIRLPTSKGRALPRVCAAWSSKTAWRGDIAPTSSPTERAGKSAKAFLAELEFKAAEFEWVCGQSLVRTYEAPVRRTPPGYVRASADSGSGHHPLSLPGPLTAIPEFGHSATSSSTSKPLG